MPSHVVLKTNDDSNLKQGMVYYPITSSGQKGFFDVLVRNSIEDAVAQELREMSEGSFVSAKGPFPHEFQYRPNMRSAIHLIAEGNGINVMLQLIREIFFNENDNTKVRLLFASTDESDITMRAALDDIHYNASDRFEVTYLVENENNTSLPTEYIPRFAKDNEPCVDVQDDDDDEYDYVMMPQIINSKITSGIVKAFLEDDLNMDKSERTKQNNHDPFILVAGPPRMMELVVGQIGPAVNRRRNGQKKLGGILGELGYTDDMVCKI